MSDFWEPNVFSRDDGSPARVVHTGHDYVVVENENGDAWIETDLLAWEPADA